MTQDTRFRRSTSGAYIATLGDVVVKTGQGAVGERIDEQADWLADNPGAHVVRVCSRAPGVLVMPRLTEWGAHAHGSSRLDAHHVHDLVVAAVSDVWAHDPVGPTRPYYRDLYELEHRIEAYFGECVGTSAVEIEKHLRWNDLITCRTHGDPTWCNTLWSNDTLKLIDPIPATERIPDIRAVDLAKLLQSCMGWEGIMHGWPVTGYTDAWMWVCELCLDTNEWNATRYWCLIHLARLMPYVTNRPEVVYWAKGVARDVCGL